MNAPYKRTAVVFERGGEDRMLAGALSPEATVRIPRSLTQSSSPPPTKNRITQFVENAVQIGPYKLGESLGEGSFAEVKCCRRINSTTNSDHQTLAIKIISKAKICGGIKQATNIDSEIACMHSLQQQHAAGTLRLLDVLHSDTRLYFVMEHHGRDLFDMCCTDQCAEETETVATMRKIVLAVAEVHAGGVAHRDIKPENLLINTELNVKLCDYGLATHYRQGEELHEFCGSKGFFCPEMITSCKYDGFKVCITVPNPYFIRVVHAPPHHHTPSYQQH
jgi:serine/threonine protein kinase